MRRRTRGKANFKMLERRKVPAENRARCRSGQAARHFPFTVLAAHALSEDRAYFPPSSSHSPSLCRPVSRQPASPCSRSTEGQGSFQTTYRSQASDVDEFPHEWMPSVLHGCQLVIRSASGSATVMAKC
ncbi:hypothetical protein BD311DRAFT_752099 [Dichomitus squalens]|uniref:Uncharacterized protein n=1 Tax=Dichomitus squalens TaxID=114155 RepID=A0A4Q9MUP6_9APHY|nr:hypothetical protein BD311DRAFT_752099 [Dichomitus squalens]